VELDRLAVLAEPQRRRVYDALLVAPAPLTVTELAAAVDSSRTLTTFHLARLAEAGLVEGLAPEAEPGRRGRPSSRYRVSTEEVSASVPARRYDLVAEVLLDAAAAQRDGERLTDAASQAARQVGRRLGSSEPAGRAGPMRRVERLLARLGYLPVRRGGELVLRNCPFAKLRDPHLELVCGINVSLAKGLLEGTGTSDVLAAELRPTAGCCCVVVTQS
jgi:predicted ArsR family transcriptional regulator